MERKIQWEEIEKIKKIIMTSYTKANVLREIGLTLNPGNYDTLNSFINANNLDISHFTGKSHGTTGAKLQLPLNEVLIINSTYARNNLKRRLLKEGLKKNKCEVCGLERWEGKPLTMILDHINGVNNDNRLENLRMVCPNCNSQLPTHCKGAGWYSEAEKYYCIDCGKQVKDKRHKRCVFCMGKYLSIKKRTKNRPPLEVLEKETKEMGFVKTGKKYNVSDNAIRKWIKQYKKYGDVTQSEE